MKCFFKKIILFSLPLLIFIVVGINLDILKVFKSYDQYYDNDNIVSLNRTLVSTKILKKNKETTNYNAFIFGSSRSQAFKAEHWKNYLPETSNPFHYDGWTENIYSIYKKIEFLDLQNFKIDHALIIIDRSTLISTAIRNTHHQINPIEFNDVSTSLFYKVNLKASLDLKLVVSYIDYSIFNKHRSYMANQIRRFKYPDTFTPIYNDVYYDYDKLIAEDSLGYYKLMIKKKRFKKRPVSNYKKAEVSIEEIKILNAIKTIFKKHNTDFKIVISPIYNQIPMELEQLEVLQTIFNPNKIYNFSGVNTFTNSISNFYESSHYRPVVANKILDSIY